MADQLVRALLQAHSVRVVAAVTTKTVREAVRRHGLTEAAVVALGRALTSGTLLATLTKGGERVTLQISGDGPLSRVTVDANDEGDVRGYVSPHGTIAPLGRQHRPQIAAAIGRGQVTVWRDFGEREQYRGAAAMVTGEIDEDVEAYLRQSEQLDSALGCEVILAADGSVLRAGGVLVQAMPGGEPELIREVQHKLRTTLLYDAMAGPTPPADAPELARVLLGSETLQLLDERPVRFECGCSLARARSLIGMFDVAEVDDMIAKDGQAEITCNFCSERYVLDRATLERIREELARAPRERN